MVKTTILKKLKKRFWGWSPTSSSYPTPTPVIETDEVVEENTSDEDGY